MTFSSITLYHQHLWCYARPVIGPVGVHMREWAPLGLEERLKG